mmetsp:Transcript_36684/g.94997  ORF Transcript_36684/g.94997 Transcript_36684/m.94997 type:complete len:210 (-) Transcript_36684:833-1462(-)
MYDGLGHEAGERLSATAEPTECVLQLPDVTDAGAPSGVQLPPLGGVVAEIEVSELLHQPTEAVQRLRDLHAQHGAQGDRDQGGSYDDDTADAQRLGLGTRELRLHVPKVQVHLPARGPPRRAKGVARQHKHREPTGPFVELQRRGPDAEAVRVVEVLLAPVQVGLIHIGFALLVDRWFALGLSAAEVEEGHCLAQGHCIAQAPLRSVAL